MIQKPRIRLRRAVLAGVAGVTASLAVASMAWACTVPAGNTWYSDGSLSKVGRPGDSVTAYATGAARGSMFQLVIGNTVTPGHGGHNCMDNWTPINPNWRTSSQSGFIGNTTGTIPNYSPGEWQICFRQQGGATATTARIFTIL